MTNSILDQLSALFRGTRAGQRVVDGAAGGALSRIVWEHLEQERAAEFAERQRLASERARLVAEEATAASQRHARVAAAMKQLEEAMETARAIEREYNAVKLQAFGESLAASSRLARLAAELRATADERIAAFIEELDERTARKSLQVVRRVNRLTDEVRFRSNRESVEAAVAAIQAARSAAEALQLEALDEAAVAERIDALRASIPEVEPVDVPMAGAVSGL